MRTLSEYVPPTSIDEAEQRLTALHTAIAEINHDLGDRKAAVQLRGHLPREEWESYVSWRRSASTAKFFKEREAAQLKEWRKAALARGERSTIDAQIIGQGSHQRLSEALELLCAIIDDIDCDLTQPQQQRIVTFLRREGIEP